MIKQVDVPEGKSGNWEAARFEVTEDGAALENIQAMFGGGRTITPGTYIRLTHHGHVIMSDTPAEMSDLSEPIRIAKQLYRSKSRDVLINGLGLGVVLQTILDDPTIEHLTIIEQSADVIALVAPHWKNKYGDRLTIIHANAFEWKPPKNTRYCVVWHDIWNNITSDNLPEMHRLHRKYGRRCDWQGSWCRWECEQARRGK